MKQVLDSIVECGPFVFCDNNADRLKKVYLEICKEYPFFKKMFEYENKKIAVLVSVMGDEFDAEYMNQSIFISNRLLKSKELIKRSLTHEYIHFMQDLNIKKNFPDLSLEVLFKSDNFKVFLFFMFSEFDAYLKSNLIYDNKFTEPVEMDNFAKAFEIYSCKFSNFGYAEEFNFLNMKNYIYKKKEFIKIAQCLLNTFTSPEYGGEVFPKYDINWDKMFEVFKEVYVLNRNFDMIAHAKNYSSKKLNYLLYKKFKFEDAKRFILNYEFPNKVNNSLLDMNKKER